MRAAPPNAAVFLDRDGVINRDLGYVHRIEDFQFIPGALAACRDLYRAGYKLIVVTNQAGIARGYYDESTFIRLTTWMAAYFSAAGAPLAGVYHCPHHPEGVVPPYNIYCECRKPAPGLIKRAVSEHHVDVAVSALVGDKESDLLAGERAGIGKRFLVYSGDPAISIQDNVMPSLVEVVDCLIHGASHQRIR